MGHPKPNISQGGTSNFGTPFRLSAKRGTLQCAQAMGPGPAGLPLLSNLWGLGFRVLAEYSTVLQEKNIPLKNPTPITENQTEKNMEDKMETGVYGDM